MSNNRDKNSRDKRFRITELFMARAGKKDWTNCYYGTITRFNDDNGREVSVSGKIDMKKGHIWARAKNEKALGEKLDELVTLDVMYGIDYMNGNVMYVAENKLNIN